MKRILITGMSGVGKSSVIAHLQAMGLCAIDTDADAWSEWAPEDDDSLAHPDWIWREDRMAALLADNSHLPLFVSGCKSNQGKFYPLFDRIVLLTAPTDVLLERIANRANNDFGKTAKERAHILNDIDLVLPLLQATSDVEIDTGTHSISEVVRIIVDLAQR